MLEAGLVGKSDEEQLAFATGPGCVLYSFNVSDFSATGTSGSGRHQRWR